MKKNKYFEEMNNNWNQYNEMFKEAFGVYKRNLANNTDVFEIDIMPDSRKKVRTMMIALSAAGIKKAIITDDKSRMVSNLIAIMGCGWDVKGYDCVVREQIKNENIMAGIENDEWLPLGIVIEMNPERV